MISIRRASLEELPDCGALSVERCAIEKNGVVVAYLGISAVSPFGGEGHPWFIPVRKDLYSNRELIKYARLALEIWAGKYDPIVAVAEEGENVGWFRFLGFRVDRTFKPIYAGGKTMVYMEYEHGRGRPNRSPEKT
jgi:hypothetical protein